MEVSASVRLINQPSSGMLLGTTTLHDNAGHGIHRQQRLILLDHYGERSQRPLLNFNMPPCVPESDLLHSGQHQAKLHRNLHALGGFSLSIFKEQRRLDLPGLVFSQLGAGDLLNLGLLVGLADC